MMVTGFHFMDQVRYPKVCRKGNSLRALDHKEVATRLTMYFHELFSLVHDSIKCGPVG